MRPLKAAVGLSMNLVQHVPQHKRLFHCLHDSSSFHQKLHSHVLSKNACLGLGLGSQSYIVEDLNLNREIR